MRVLIVATMAVTVAASGLWASPAAAQLEPIPPQCAGLVGTFLTTKSTKSEQGISERSLIALTNGGHAFMSDSAQGGDLRYQPFGTSRGAWSCTEAAGDRIAFRAVMLDFTYPTGEKPDAKVVRVETEGELNAVDATISGSTRVMFYSLSADPLSGDPPDDELSYTFTGQKVTVGPAHKAAN